MIVVVPCFNEEKVLPLMASLFLSELSLLSKKNKISKKSKILFVDDGSSDKTWEIIKSLCQKDFESMEKMIDEYEAGSEIVYGVRGEVVKNKNEIFLRGLFLVLIGAIFSVAYLNKIGEKK